MPGSHLATCITVIARGTALHPTHPKHPTHARNATYTLSVTTTPKPKKYKTTYFLLSSSLSHPFFKIFGNNLNVCSAVKTSANTGPISFFAHLVGKFAASRAFVKYAITDNVIDSSSCCARSEEMEGANTGAS
jgi:hypothetical protein